MEGVGFVGMWLVVWFGCGDWVYWMDIGWGRGCGVVGVECWFGWVVCWVISYIDCVCCY